MKKYVAILLVILFVGILVFGCSKNKEPQIIYQNTIYFAFGNIRIRIYDNGDVMEDKEIEDPNHMVKYEKIMVLDDKQVKQIQEKINNGGDEKEARKELEKFINLIVYGKETPGNMGF